MTDPVSWLQIEQGWNVVTSDGVSVGTVAQVECDKQNDIFDGLAVQAGQNAQILYVPGEQVGPIYPGEVTLRIASAETTLPWALLRRTENRAPSSAGVTGPYINSAPVASGRSTPLRRH